MHIISLTGANVKGINAPAKVSGNPQTYVQQNFCLTPTGKTQQALKKSAKDISTDISMPDAFLSAYILNSFSNKSMKAVIFAKSQHIHCHSHRHIFCISV